MSNSHARWDPDLLSLTTRLRIWECRARPPSDAKSGALSGRSTPGEPHHGSASHGEGWSGAVLPGP